MIKNILNKLHTKNGKLILSIILGLGLATIFRKVCKDLECFIYKAPPESEIIDSVYAFNNKCYRYKKNNISCGKKKITINA